MSIRIYNGYIRRYEKWCRAYQFKPDCETILKQYETTLKYNRMLEPKYVKRIIGFLKNHYFPEIKEDIEREEKAKIAIAQSRRYQAGIAPGKLKYRQKIWNDIMNNRKLALPRAPRRYKQLFTREEYDKLLDYAQMNYKTNRLALMLWLNVLRADLKPKQIYSQMNSNKRIINVILPISFDLNLKELVQFINKERSHQNKIFPLTFQSYLKLFKFKCRILLGIQDANFEMFRRTLSHFNTQICNMKK